MSALRAIALCIGLAAGLAAAKGVEDYVHGGAALYIQGRLQEASVEVEEGLRKFPQDARLKALAAQLKAMKDQQKQDQGGGEGQGGQGSQDKNQKDSSQNQKGQGKDQDKQDQQKQNQGKDPQKQDQDKDKQGGDKDKQKEQDTDQDKHEGKDGGQDGQPPQEKPGQEGDSTGKGAAPVPPGQMSKEEAERLLNSYQDDEKREQKNMQRRYRKQAEVEEDW